MYKSLVKREHFEKCFRFYFFIKTNIIVKEVKLHKNLKK